MAVPWVVTIGVCWDLGKFSRIHLITLLWPSLVNINVRSGHQLIFQIFNIHFFLKSNQFWQDPPLHKKKHLNNAFLKFPERNTKSTWIFFFVCLTWVPRRSGHLILGSRSSVWIVPMHYLENICLTKFTCFFRNCMHTLSQQSKSDDLLVLSPLMNNTI